MAPSHTIIVTGGAGFVGSWIVKTLREEFPGFRVVVLDRTKSEDLDDMIRSMEADITDEEAITDLICSIKPVAVFHTAGIVPKASERYDTSTAAFDRCCRVNVGGTQNVLQAAQISGTRYFIYTSSVTVLVDDLTRDHKNMNESMPIGYATLPYGRTKALAESLVLSANNTNNMKTCAIRPAVTFGPGDNNCIPTLHSCIAKGETPYVIGDPTTTLYDFCYVSNIADAHILALRNLMTSGTAAGRPFLISNGEPVPFRTFCLAVWKGFGHVPRYEIKLPLSLAWFAGLMAEVATWFTGGQTALSRGSVKDLTVSAYSDLRNAREILGYRPKVSLEEGIRRSCEAYSSLLSGAQKSKPAP